MRLRLRVTGIVQGVGFRPFVYGLATRLGLSGFVLNDSDGVLIEVEGEPLGVRRFERSLAAHPPPLAVVERIEGVEVPILGERSFEIRRSRTPGVGQTPISPDIATCEACLEEIDDPTERRFGYPFTNCTNCGPRLTITTGVPYDRVNTTMRGFPLCAACESEYEDPRDRRFHAQPIACPRCGPSLSLLDSKGRWIEGEPLTVAASLIRDGRIVAVKGIGGYHLMCDAAQEDAVAQLRLRKGREEKPLAIMAENSGQAGHLIELDDAAEAIIKSRRRPIVLAPRRAAAPVAESVAPANRSLGVMLAYTPLHHLLLRRVGKPVVATSGNYSDEPIIYTDDEAQSRLGRMVDALLTHNRDIHTRCDDSVVRVVGGRAYPIRRARGYAPEPLLVKPTFGRPVLGAGAQLKHTFCLGQGSRAIVSHHIGDLETWPAMSAFVDSVEHYERIFDVRPEIVAHDLHPDYLSTKWAHAREGVRPVPVQHHHAHIASCLADNSRTDRVIGLALDGTGYGADGSLWGCEVLACDLTAFTRHLHLRRVPLPGGEQAVRQPWRMAAVYLDAAFGERSAEAAPPHLAVTASRWAPVLRTMRAGINSPLSSSAGRLFDAAAAVCGIRYEVSYEGQAAAELEQAADPTIADLYRCRVEDGVIDGVELIAALAEDICRGRPVAEAAAAFHNGLAAALVAACELVRDREELSAVALSGGTWQNLLLLERVREGLSERGFEVLLHRRVPPNDGGISLGQAVVANARLLHGII